MLSCVFYASAYNHICVYLRVMFPRWCRGEGLRPFFLNAHAGIWLVRVVFHRASRSNNIPSQHWHAISFLIAFDLCLEGFPALCTLCTPQMSHAPASLAKRSLWMRWDSCIASGWANFLTWHWLCPGPFHPPSWTRSRREMDARTALCCSLPASWDAWLDNISGDEVVRALSPALLLWSLMYPRWLVLL